MDQIISASLASSSGLVFSAMRTSSSGMLPWIFCGNVFNCPFVLQDFSPGIMGVLTPVSRHLRTKSKESSLSKTS